MGLFKKKPKDDFKALAKERRKGEDDEPWFAGVDDGPELDVETGIGSNLREPRPDRRLSD
ncbi:hypothetical protein [Actinospongicola halichondriae]|uniref:hypothetical protein n=1 Tax=Actinospongicola halichondriae TaxID=3236844 RepID=UPI003D45B333